MSPLNPECSPRSLLLPPRLQNLHAGRFRKVSSVTVSDLEQLREQEAGCPETTPREQGAEAAGFLSWRGEDRDRHTHGGPGRRKVPESFSHALEDWGPLGSEMR